MHVHRGYVLSKEDVDGIHIVPARGRRDEQGGTYPFYKIGQAFILHYPAKYDAKGAERWRWFILDDLLRNVMGRNSRTRRHSIDALPGSRISSGSACERIKQGCTCSPCLT